MVAPNPAPPPLTFEAPVVVWADRLNHGAGQHFITTVPDGLQALHRHGMERLRTDPLWKAAAAALARAQLTPTPAALDGARSALQAVAKEAGCLAEK
ncbi:MAG TPA: hypothetical protein VHN20_19865 [Beijerinckiaceae bacterium]|nr:hypothetical protein [Beijerinckiaceae bacterium]